MSKRDNIIKDLEDDFNDELDANFDAGVNDLCNGDNCRSEECICYENFEFAVREQLEKQADEREAEGKRMFALYNAEVSRGLYIPKNQAGEDLMQELDELDRVL